MNMLGHKNIRLVSGAVMITGILLLASCAPKNPTILGIPQNIWVQLTPDQQNQIQLGNQQRATAATMNQNQPGTVSNQNTAMPMLPPQ